MTKGQKIPAWRKQAVCNIKQVKHTRFHIPNLLCGTYICIKKHLLSSGTSQEFIIGRFLVVYQERSISVFRRKAEFGPTFPPRLFSTDVF